MRKSLRHIIRFYILLATPFLWTAAQNIPVLSYADDLFRRGEYYRAISEYDRYLFFQGKTKEDSNYCSIQILKCYYYGQEYKDAITFGESYWNLHIGQDQRQGDLFRYIGLSYLKMGYPKSAMIYFDKNTDDIKSSFLRGMCNLYLLNWDKAIDQFTFWGSSSDSTMSLAGKDLARIASEGKLLPRKSPFLAGVLSTVVPGAGYIYTGSYQTGILSLALNVLLLGTAYELHRNDFKWSGGFFFLIGFGWYIGNIYGSYTSAVKFNESLQQNYINDSLKKYDYIMR